MQDRKLGKIRALVLFPTFFSECSKIGVHFKMDGAESPPTKIMQSIYEITLFEFCLVASILFLVAGFSLVMGWAFRKLVKMSFVINHDDLGEVDEK